MTLRTTALILGLAALAGGCTVAPRHDVRVYPRDQHVVVHEHDAYEGYYYVRIVYLGGVPWYVDDDLRARPLPPHLRSHFRYGTWARSLPPSFGRDAGVRDGYRLSRIVYVDGVPHHVDEGRHARPIPSRLRSRFAYDSVARHDERPRGPAGRMAPPFAHGGGEARPPAYGRANEASPVYRVERAPVGSMPPGPMREAERPGLPANEQARAQPAPGGGALGRAAERAREAAREQPPANARAARPAVHEAANAPRGGMPSDPQRAVPADRTVPQRQAEPAVRSPGRDAPQATAPRDRGQPAATARPPAKVAADKTARKAEPAKSNGKGRGRADGDEADSADERDDGTPGRNRRDN